MTSRSWTDEQLSAFLDGELSSSDSAALQLDVETDAALATRLEWLGSANGAFVNAISQIDRKPLSAGLEAALETPPAARIIVLRPRGVGAFLNEHRAIAASLLCVAGVFGVMSIQPRGSDAHPLIAGPDGVIAANSPLHHALETASTGQMNTVEGMTTVPRLTFVSDRGEYCRQFDIATAVSTSAAIACRGDEGWRTQVAAFGLPKLTGDFQTAATTRVPALETFLDQRMSGAPMTGEEEAALIGRGWARPPT